MTNKEIFKIWAPYGAMWVDWVRPVPFIGITNDLKTYNTHSFFIPTLNYLENFYTNTAIIVDLPGIKSIEEGLALAKLGFRPIPVYNGTDAQLGAIATVDNYSIKVGLFMGALILQNLDINYDAPPAFLLDSNRTNRFKMDVSVFDNSWDIYSQDLPTANYLIKNGIKNILIRGDRIQKDLKKVLYKFYEKGINIFITNGFDKPQRVKLPKIHKAKEF